MDVVFRAESRGESLHECLCGSSASVDDMNREL